MIFAVRRFVTDSWSQASEVRPLSPILKFQISNLKFQTARFGLTPLDFDPVQFSRGVDEGGSDVAGGLSGAGRGQAAFGIEGFVSLR